VLRLRLLAPLLLAGLVAAPASAAYEDTFSPEGDGPRYPARADGRVTPQPSLAACPLAPGEAVTVDGRLDEPVWARAEAGFGFVQHDPERWAAAAVPTVFKVAYGPDALYLAVACWEDDMAQVARRLARRDNIESSDFVSFYLDPYHDRLTGYNFRVTADGVKADHYLYDDTGRDPDWNAVWDAETSEDDRGWYLEVRIPFQVLRFKPADEMTWGLQIYRWLHGRAQDTGWATWDRNLSGFVSRWGTLTGLQGVANPRALEVLPYVAAGLTDPADPTTDREELQRYFNWGADFKYNLTSALTAQLTVQPDFGQVESDPALLNLSPFETFFAEKRPFFVEGARFFEHPTFNLFYSRRIGTGEPGSRIRAAGKLTGKLGGNTSVAVLGALTDITHPEQVHNPFAASDRTTGYAVTRLERDLAGGAHRVGVMATGVWRENGERISLAQDRGFRDAFSGGVDWDLTFLDKAWAVRGSAVGTAVDPHPVVTDPTLDHSPVFGTAGKFEVSKQAGVWRGGASGYWESDRFDPNDLGFLQANDEIQTRAWLQRRYDADGEDSLLKTSNQYVNVWKSWLYGDQERVSDTTGEVVWQYDGGHPQGAGIYLESYNQTHGNWDFTGWAEHGLAGRSKYSTRAFAGQRGPLMENAAYSEVGLRVQTDWTRPRRHTWRAEYAWDAVGSRTWNLSYGVRHDVGRHLALRLDVGYADRLADAQWLDNLADAEVGIDGVAYVFGRLDQNTLDLTLRGSWLLDRDRSLELYLQPYLTTGQYSRPRYLAVPDSRDLRPYDLDPAPYDFDFAALNINLVWRWEYRPGSTFFLVWTHGRDGYAVRGQTAADDRLWLGDLAPDLLWNQEPTNTVLAKFNYWFSL